MVLAIFLLAGTVLSVNQGRNFSRLVEWLGLDEYLVMVQPPANVAPKRTRRLGPTAAFPARLVAKQAEELVRLIRSPSQAAYDRCRQLGASGDAAPSFQASGNEWECILSQELGSTPEPAVLFVQARGLSPDSFRSFRIKLSLLDPSQDDNLLRLALDSIDRFGLALSPDSRRYIEERIAARRNFSSLLENYRIVFERERDDEKRFNLLIVPLSSSTTCMSPRPKSEGMLMRSTIVNARLGCLSFPDKTSGQAIQAD
jgi:hypothetical protein